MITRSVFLLLASITTTLLQAEVSTPWKNFDNLKCNSELQALALQNGWDKESFREHVSDAYNKKVFRNFSHKIGEWMEVHITENSAPEIMLLKDSQITRLHFDHKCVVESTPESWPWHLEKVFTTKTDQDWTNEDLKNLVKSGKKGMIYSWSPKFAYSVLEMPRFEKMARRLGYEFTAVVDPRVPKTEVEAALDVMDKKNLFSMKRSLASKTYHRNVSTDIYMRGEFNHFPVVYIYNNKKIHSRWITGVMTDNGFKEMAKTFAGELK